MLPVDFRHFEPGPQSVSNWQAIASEANERLENSKKLASIARIVSPPWRPTASHGSWPPPPRVHRPPPGTHRRRVPEEVKEQVWRDLSARLA
jgi:hypothetical protein